MRASQDNLILLMQSRSIKAQMLAIAAGFLFFLPKITQIADNPSLSLWGRIGHASTAAGELLFTIGVAAAKPETFFDEDGHDVNA